MSDSSEQQHPLGIYLKIWILLFVLSFFSYLVDYFQLQGMLRWSLIVIFMLLKAGFIVAIFMHFKWERISLQVALLFPTGAILVLMILMALESDYIHWSRLMYLSN